MAETQGRKKQDIGQDEAWAANLKNIFSGEMDESTRMRGIVQLYLGNVAATLGSINNAIAQGANNLVTNCNLTNKQAVAHRDVAIDSTWDPGPGEESLKED